MYQLDDFLKLLEENSETKPFSFKYDGKEMDLKGVKGRMERETDLRFKMIYDVVPNVLRVTLAVNIYEDFPVIEYTPYFENIGSLDTGIISEVSVLDHETEDLATFGLQKMNDQVMNGNSRISVRYNLGSKANGADFLPQRRDLFSRPGCNKLELECEGAWCSSDFLPYFAVDNDAMNGINLAIGWNGAWKFSVEKDVLSGQMGYGRKSRIRCGMKRAEFLLHPGEKVMQPGILLHFRQGKSIRDGQNEFRRFMIAHHSPRNSRGELLKPPICFEVWGGLETDKQIRRIQLIHEKQLPYEAFWIDAGWMGSPGPCPHFLEKSQHTSDWYTRVGSWDFNTWAHPQGLRPIADAAHQAGMRLLVWFEALRVSSASRGAVLKEHPEWLLGDHSAAAAGKNVNFLLNIGIPEARKYLFDTIRAIIERERIDDYREDFNMDAWNCLISGDEPGRTGITEMKFVEGFYLFWEALRQQFPDMYIDNCSGGGRRLDYKTASLSFPLCQSDLSCYLPYEEECVQMENIFLDDWIPLHGTLNWGEDDPYHAANGLGCGYASKIWTFNGREPQEEHDYERHSKIIMWGKLLRDLHLKGDVYPLIESPEQDMRLWNGQHIHVPEENCGAVMIFRRKQSPDADFRLHLSAVDLKQKYTVEFFDGTPCRMTGGELAGLEIHLDAPRSFQFLKYEAVK